MNEPQNIDFAFNSDTVTIRASGTDATRPASFEMIAYTGAPMTIKGFERQVVIDLAGIEGIDLQRPILLAHDFEKRVGHSTMIEAVNGKLIARGIISARNQHASEVIESGKQGFPWQASVGASVLEVRNLPSGKSEVINGQKLTGPLTIATRTRLREISFVSLGADENTSARIAAKAQQDPSPLHPPKGLYMPQNADTTTNTTNDNIAGENIDATDLERKRVLGIVRVAKNFPNISAQAIEEGWTADQTELAVLKASTSKAPGPGSGIRRGQAFRPSDTGVSVLSSGLLLKMGLGDIAAESYGEAAVEMAQSQGCRTLLDICAAACRQSIGYVPNSDHELIRASFSNTDLPTALANVAEKSAAQAFMAIPSPWSPLCKRRPVSKLDTAHVISRVLFSGDLELIGPGGEIKHGTVGEETPRSVEANTRALMLALTRTEIVNDDLSVFSDTANALGRRAAATLNNDFVKTLLGNAGSFFHASNNNLGTGAGSALTYDGLSAAIKAMRKQVDGNGDAIDVEPKFLLVPPDLELIAKQLLNTSQVERNTSTNDQLPTGNPLASSLTLLVEPRLSNTRFTGNSATAWYLFSSASNSAVLAAFLNGRERPTVEYGQTDFNKLGVQYRVYHDYGFALGEPAAAYKSAGV